MVIIWYINNIIIFHIVIMICFKAWYFPRYITLMFSNFITINFWAVITFLWLPNYETCLFHHISPGVMICILIISNIVFHRRKFSYFYDKYRMRVSYRLSSYVDSIYLILNCDLIMKMEFRTVLDTKYEYKEYQYNENQIIQIW